jgi:shikimate kinase
MGSPPTSHVLVTGHSGAGKSTLAERMAKKRGMPVVSLDKDPALKKALKDQGESAKTHGGRLSFTGVRAVEQKAVRRALSSKTPSVIEGTYLSRVNPQELRNHELYLVDVLKKEVLRRRVSRQHAKDLSKGRGWSPERARGVRQRGEQIHGEYEPNMSSWRGSKDVTKVKAHDRKLGDKTIKIRAHARGGHVEQRAKERTTVTPEEIRQLRKSLLRGKLRKGETYHHTWPGRGHGIIVDVGKKKPKHVLKTLYKASDNPPGRRLTKTATPKEEIHRLANKKGIPWDDDPKFKRWSKKVTGKSCLDAMSPAQLLRLKRALKARKEKKR